MKLPRLTKKLYYGDLYLREARARIVKIGTDFLELDATVAFPEGGGQESDSGTITLLNGTSLRFVHAKRLYGDFSGLPEFSDLRVDGVIWHIIHPDDQMKLAELSVDDEVFVHIDVERRARLSLSHTASHFLYLSVGMHRPDAIAQTIGCHIKVDGARFDFAVSERFTQGQTQNIEMSANIFITNAAKITVSAHPAVPDARLWHCGEHTIPCGGTHLDNAAPVGLLQIRRKSVGAGKERLTCTFPHAVIDLSRYHF